VKELRARGVEFERYDMPGERSLDGLVVTARGAKAAWFRDTEGNILAIVENARAKTSEQKGKVVIDVTISLDGFVAGPDDGPKNALGGRGGEHLFDWYSTPEQRNEGELFDPKGANLGVVDEMRRRAGVMLTGRRTYEIANGWNGSHPFGIPVVVMTHHPPNESEVPKGKSQIVFVTDGIESAVAKAKELAGRKDVGIGGASAGQQALAAGLVDEVFVHVAPLLLGAGVRLFDRIGDHGITLRPLSMVATPEATHLHYAVARG